MYRVALSKDGKVLATQGLTEEPKVGEAYHLDHKVHLWDAATGKKLRQIEVVADPSTRQARRHADFSVISHFQFSPDTKALATAGGDGVLRVWDVATGKELRHWDTTEFVSTFAFSPDGKTLASLGGGNTVRLWDAVTGKELREHPSHRHGFHVLALSRDGRTLASASWDRDVRLWDAATGRQRQQRMGFDEGVQALSFSADGSTLTALGDDGKARVWDIATGSDVRQFLAPVQGRGSKHTLSLDGKTWASASQDRRNGSTDLLLWDAATAKERQVLVGNRWWVGALAFSPDSRTLYCWSGDKKVRLWDVATGKRLREFSAGERNIYTGCFSPDGSWFACAGPEQALLLYELATGNAVRRIEIPAMRDDNRALAFSPDSRTLAVGDEQGTVHLVEAASGKFRRRLLGGHQGSISALLFSTDSERLVSGSTDTTALVWDLNGRLNAPFKPLNAAELDACWAALAGEDAERAYEAICRLAASPTEMLDYLNKRLRPVARADTMRVARLIAELDSNRFAVREQAATELENLGETATAMCRKALEGEPSLELRRRLEKMLKKQEQERWAPSPERLRLLRALEALELAATPEAQRLLEKLASGVPDAYLTREAKAALERLTRLVIKP